VEAWGNCVLKALCLLAEYRARINERNILEKAMAMLEKKGDI
jgi:hypothetical protein